MGVVGLVLGLFLFFPTRKFFTLKRESMIETQKIQEMRDKLKRLKIYDKDKLEKEYLNYDSLFLPQSKSSEIVNRLTIMGKEKELSFIDITPKLLDLKEEEGESLSLSRNLKLLVLEMVWAGDFVQITDYLKAILDIRDFPVVIKSLEIKPDTLIKDRLKANIVLHSYLLS